MHILKCSNHCALGLVLNSAWLSTVAAICADERVPPLVLVVLVVAAGSSLMLRGWMVA